MIDHLGDLESDFSVFHRVGDIYDLDGPRFFRMAWRLPAYGGVMAARVLAADERTTPTPAQGSVAASSRQRAAAGAPSGPQVVELAALQVISPGLIDRKQVQR